MDFSKATVIDNALQMAGIDHTSVEHMSTEEYKKVQITQQLQRGWAQYPVNTGQQLSHLVMEKLQKLLSLGQKQKKRKVSGYRAIEIIVTELIIYDWFHNICVTVPTIKSFLKLPSGRQKILIGKIPL